MRLRKFIRRSIWTLIALATLVALFYSEENWRGARVLKTVTDKFRQAHISLSFSDYIPRPLPDSENLGALPIFRQSHLSPHDPNLYPVALAAALRNDEHWPDLPPTGNWQAGKLADFPRIDSAVAEIYRQIFKTAPTAPPSAQLDAIFPILQDLRLASGTRPDCRFEEDFDVDPPQGRPLALITWQVKLARLLTLHGLLTLKEHQPDVALTDLRVILILARGANHDPSLIGPLVAASMRASGEAILVTGLAMHSFDESQLAQLQENLGQDNSLVSYEQSLKAEAAGYVELCVYMRKSPVGWIKVITAPISDKLTQPSVEAFIERSFPTGWIALNESSILRSHLEMIRLVDTASQTVNVSGTHQLFDPSSFHRFGPAFMPWNALAFEISKALQYLPRQFATAQTWLNESQIACALERYRLSHGSYPASLDTLTPTFLASIPHDVVNAQPYHYQPEPDGSYLLYSIGWNEKDDGGIVIFDKADRNHRRLDYDQGDWVWFGPK